MRSCDLRFSSITARFQRTMINMVIVDLFYNLINGFYQLRQIPIMWLTLKMCVIMFSAIMIIFVLAFFLQTQAYQWTFGHGQSITLNHYNAIVWGSWILVVLAGYFGYKYIKLYMNIRKSRST